MNYAIKTSPSKSPIICSTPCLKNQAKLFRHNIMKFPPTLKIFGIKMENSLKLYEVHSFATSPKLRQCTTVLNADVPNCYITL